MQFKSYLHSISKQERDELLKLAQEGGAQKARKARLHASYDREQSTSNNATGAMKKHAAGHLDDSALARLFNQARSQAMSPEQRAYTNVLLGSSPTGSAQWKLTASLPRQKTVSFTDEDVVIEDHKAPEQRTLHTEAASADLSITPTSTKASARIGANSPSKSPSSPSSSYFSRARSASSPPPSPDSQRSCKSSPSPQHSISLMPAATKEGMQWQLAQATVRAQLLDNDNRELQKKLEHALGENTELRTQLAALKAGSVSQQQEMKQQVEQQLGQLHKLAAGLGKTMQQVSSLAKGAHQQNGTLQEQLKAAHAAQRQDEEMLEQQRQRIDHLERQLLQLGKKAYQPWAIASARGRSPSPMRGTAVTRPGSAPLTAPSAGRQQPMQPLLDQLDACKRREAALQSKVAALQSKVQQAKEGSSQQQLLLQQDREQLQKQLAKESAAAVTATKKLAALQLELQEAAQQSGSRERYVMQLERKLVQQHRELQQMRVKVAKAEEAAQQLVPRSCFAVAGREQQALPGCVHSDSSQHWPQEPSFSFEGAACRHPSGSMQGQCGDSPALEDDLEEEPYMPQLAAVMRKAMGVPQQQQLAQFGSSGRQDSGVSVDSEPGYALQQWRQQWQQEQQQQQQQEAERRRSVDTEPVRPGDAVRGLLAEVEALQGNLMGFEEQLSQATASMQGMGVVQGGPAGAS